MQSEGPWVNTSFDSGFFCVRVGRGLLGYGPKDGSPPGGRGAAAGESSGLPGPGRGVGGRARKPGRKPGKSRGRRRASAGNAGVAGLLLGKSPGIWAAPTRHTRADRAGVPGKNRPDLGQKPGFPGRVPGPRGGKSRFPGGKNPVFQMIVPGV